MSHTAPAVDGFEQFKAVYPRRAAWKDARKAWGQVGADRHLDAILAAVAWQKDTDQWRRGFIPLPATYLRGERWTDEPPAVLGDPLRAEYEAWRRRFAGDPQAALVTFDQFKAYVQQRRRA